HAPAVVELADAWKQVAAADAVLPPPRTQLDTYASAGQLTVSLDTDTTRSLLGDVPAAFHVGVQDILLIAYALAWAEFLCSTSTTAIGIDVEGHGREGDFAEGIDLSGTVGWFTTRYPVALSTAALRWAQVKAGDSALGAVLNDAKEQLRALPAGLTYGLLRYLNTDVDLSAPEPTIGFNYLGRLHAGADTSESTWRIDKEGLSVADIAGAVSMPLSHTAELTAATVDTGGGPRMRATWTWAPSALDEVQVSHLSELWFEALAGICAHVAKGGGGLTPSDIAPARLTQQQIDQLSELERVADILPLTPMQQGLLFHASTTPEEHDDLYAMQLDITLTGDLESDRLRTAVNTVVNRHPNLAARFFSQFDQPVQVIPISPETPWQYLEPDFINGDVQSRFQEMCAHERAAVCDLTRAAPFRAALFRVAPDRHRFVLTNHHIVLDGWSLPILAREIFASYYGEHLPAAPSYRRFVSWLADRDLGAAHAAWRDVLADFTTPTLVGSPERSGPGTRSVVRFQVPEDVTRAVSELARSCHTTVNTVLQGAWAQMLIWLTGQHDVVFGTAVSGRPTELAGAETMVGLLINTVPVRARITPATTVTDLLGQLHSTHNHTLDHQHLALSEIHRLTGHDQLFDTLFVFENYPMDGAAMLSTNGLAVTEIAGREHNHYPLAMIAHPGREIGVRVEFDTATVDSVKISKLGKRFTRVLEAMARDAGGCHDR
ncbi:MAG: condensation domain-containing protein, partial [Mycobacterium sp.]